MADTEMGQTGMEAGQTGMERIYALFGEPICVYTRAQALADGSLIDVSEVAREAGITIPAVVTQALHGDIGDIPEEHSYQSYRARLFDLLFMFTAAVRGVIPCRGDDRVMVYDFIMHVGEAEDYSVKAVCGPDDEGRPCLTFMKPEED